MNWKKNILRNKKTESFYVFCGLLVLFVYFLILACLSKGSGGGADSYVHYRIAHYAFKYPQLFLDLWGKPIFTIFSSPFAQFGFTAIKFFNIICALIAAWLCYRICKKLNLKDAPLVVVFLCFAPMYYLVSISVLTEIVFSLVLILAVYLFVEKKYFLSAITISLLPFARQEGIIILPLFLLMLIIRKQYKAIPLIAFGFLFFSSVGYFYYHDFFWVIHLSPYTGDVDYYGHGEFFHFVNAYKEIIGLPLGILFLLGIVNLIYKTATFHRKHILLVEEIFLVGGSVFIYVAAHSYVWWKGIHGSLGLTRVVAGVIPGIAIICLEGYNLLKLFFSFHKIASYVLFIAVPIVVIYIPIQQKLAPIPIGVDQAVMEKTSDWLKQNSYTDKYIYYYDPYFCFALNKDPFDDNVVHEQLPDRENPDKNVADESIVLWDAHFGPIEGGMPLEKLKNDSSFELLQTFNPDVPFTIGQNNYEIDVFKKIKR